MSRSRHRRRTRPPCVAKKKRWNARRAMRSLRLSDRRLPDPPEYTARSVADVDVANICASDLSGSSDSSHFCYLLHADTGPLQPRIHTYVGYTVNPPRRIRQHNGLIGGGAGSTRTSRYRWQFAVIVGGLDSKSAGLRFEIAWQACRRSNYRLDALHRMLHRSDHVSSTVNAGIWVAASRNCIEAVAPLVPPHIPLRLLPSPSPPSPPSPPQ